MKNYFKSLLEDNSGGFSSVRFQMLIWSLGVLLVWIIMSIKVIISPIDVNISLPIIPDSVLILLIGITSAKTVQRFGEKSEKNNE